MPIRSTAGIDCDTVEYYGFYAWFNATAFPSGAVDVDLERSVQSGGMAEGDVLISIENVSGSRENDLIRGNGERNDLTGDGGDDVIDGRGGDDCLFGDCSIWSAGPGNDQLNGGAGNDFVSGQEGNDTLSGGLDNDQLFGDDGNDTLIGGQGVDDLDGGAGVDTANYASSAAAASRSTSRCRDRLAVATPAATRSSASRTSPDRRLPIR